MFQLLRSRMSFEFLLSAVCCCFCLSGATVLRGEEPAAVVASPVAEAAATQTATQAADPVILLTGFEPFGGSPKNPSWEGIKNLDNTQWQGYRLACREIPVIWGEPKKQLDKWIAELHPVAIFAFGQGGNEGFAIETTAANKRNNFADNAGLKPKQTEIIPAAPAVLPATIDHERLATTLAAQGYAIRQSKRAGGYLCEEMLYTLEFLKQESQPNVAVMFCHVPGLNRKVGSALVTGDYVQQFVLALLTAWQSVQEDPRKGEIQKLVETYFGSWSKQDMDTYGKCFATDATVQYVTDDGRVLSSPLKPFLAGQKEVHRTSNFKMVETPEKVDIGFDAKLAKACVFWKLKSAPETLEYGYDHFTLVHTDQGWKIANLIYYKVDAPPK